MGSPGSPTLADNQLQTTDRALFSRTFGDWSRVLTTLASTAVAVRATTARKTTDLINLPDMSSLQDEPLDGRHDGQGPI